MKANPFAPVADKAKSGNWIAQGASKRPGLFKKKAQKAGASTAEYAEKEAGALGKLGQEARFAKNVAKVRP